MIEARELCKSFGEHLALNRVNLSLETSKTHVLLGSSGCGKSTLLRILCGLIPASSGSISLDGQEVRPEGLKELSQKFGYVIQDGGLFPHLSGFENITLKARTLGWKAERIQKRVAELSDLTGLNRKLLDRFPRRMSGGQRQRIGIMRALMLDPPYLLLDEPLGALDPIVRADIQNQLRNIFSSLKKTVMLVTHDIGEAALFGDTITLLRAGRVVQHGNFDDLIKKPAAPFVTQFIQAQRPVEKMRSLS